MTRNSQSLKALSTFLLSFCLLAGVKPQSKLFEGGTLEVFNVTGLRPEVARFPELGFEPTKKFEIRGGFFQSYDEKTERFTFEIAFRDKNDPDGYKTGLILQLSASFNLSSEYEGKGLVEALSSQDPRYTLKNQKVRLFGYEKTFYIFKGEEVKDPVEIRYLEAKVSVQQTGPKKYKKQRETARIVSLDLTISRLRVQIQRGETELLDIFVPVNSLDNQSPSSEDLITSVILVIWILHILFDLAIYNLIQGEGQRCRLVGVCTTRTFFILFCIISFKCCSASFWVLRNSLLGLLVVGLFQAFGVLLVMLYYRDKYSLRKEGSLLALFVFLNTVWLILLSLRFDLILRLFYFYALVLTIDLFAGVVGQEQTQYRPQFWLALLSCLNLFLDQLFIYLIYAVLFQQRHGEYPELFHPYLKNDLYVILGVSLLAGLVDLWFYALKVRKSAIAGRGGEKGPAVGGEGKLELAGMEVEKRALRINKKHDKVSLEILAQRKMERRNISGDLEEP